MSSSADEFSDSNGGTAASSDDSLLLSNSSIHSDSVPRLRAREMRGRTSEITRPSQSSVDVLGDVVPEEGGGAEGVVELSAETVKNIEVLLDHRFLMGYNYWFALQVLWVSLFSCYMVIITGLELQEAIVGEEAVIDTSTSVDLAVAATTGFFIECVLFYIHKDRVFRQALGDVYGGKWHMKLFNGSNVGRGWEYSYRFSFSQIIFNTPFSFYYPFRKICLLFMSFVIFWYLFYAFLLVFLPDVSHSIRLLLVLFLGVCTFIHTVYVFVMWWKYRQVASTPKPTRLQVISVIVELAERFPSAVQEFSGVLNHETVGINLSHDDWMRELAYAALVHVIEYELVFVHGIENELVYSDYGVSLHDSVVPVLVECLSVPVTQHLDLLQGICEICERLENSTVVHARCSLVLDVLFKGGSEFDFRPNGPRACKRPSKVSRRLGSLMLFATGRGATPVVEFLVRMGAPVNEVDAEGQAVLHLAVRSGVPSCLAFFLETDDHGNSTDEAVLDLLNIGDTDGNTPLATAVAKNSKKAVRLLLKYGADACVRNVAGQNALELARTLRHTDLVALIGAKFPALLAESLTHDHHLQAEINHENVIETLDLSEESGKGLNYDVFLSHAGADKREMLRLALFLAIQGFSVFFDLHSIESSIAGNIKHGLGSSSLLLTFMTESFFQSRWACIEAWSFLVHRYQIKQTLNFPVVSFVMGMEMKGRGSNVVRNCGPRVNQELVGLGQGEAAWALGGVLSTVRCHKFVKEFPLKLEEMCSMSKILYDALEGQDRSEIRLLDGKKHIRFAEDQWNSIEKELERWGETKSLEDVPRDAIDEFVGHYRSILKLLP